MFKVPGAVYLREKRCIWGLLRNVRKCQKKICSKDTLRNVNVWRVLEVCSLRKVFIQLTRNVMLRPMHAFFERKGGHTNNIS